MKIVGIVGSNADFSYNRLLLNFIAKNFKKLIDVEVLDIKDVPMFNQSDDQTNSAPIQHLNKKIAEADGVIDRKSTRLNSSHVAISYAVFCLKKKINKTIH